MALSLISVVWAGTPPAEQPKAPPEVEAALRARVTQFFQYEVKGKFYHAEQLVAEESKEFFVGASKPTYAGFEIQGIEYSGNFTKATVLVKVQRMVPAEGFLGVPMPWLAHSRWKLENGQWCWYADLDDLRRTPFGTMPHGSKVYSIPSAGMPAPGSAPAPAGLPGGMPGIAPGAIAGLPGGGGAVIADKAALELKASEPSSGQVTLVNQMSTPVTVSLLWGGIPGFTAKLDRKDLKPGEKAVVSLQTNGAVKAPAQPTTVAVRVDQTNQLIPIKVSFAGPAK